jgi:hypothetical protein
MKKTFQIFRTQLTTLNFHKENNFDKHHKFNSKYMVFHTYACLIEFVSILQDILLSKPNTYLESK